MTIVIGIVRITKIGFTRTFKIASTPATINAVRKPSTWAPGSTEAQINTATADSIRRIKKLFIVDQ